MLCFSDISRRSKSRKWILEINIMSKSAQHKFTKARTAVFVVGIFCNIFVERAMI